MKGISARTALFAVTVLALSCVECDGGVQTGHSKLGQPANRATAVGSLQRRISLRTVGVRNTGKLSSRRQLVVKHRQVARLVTQAARRKTLDRLASNVRSSRKQIEMLGIASFYSEDRETASGERFDGHGLNAAHPSFPFGTRLRVTNLRNGRSVTVRVNDRGPFVGGRIIDLTSAPAEALGMIDAGLAKVTLDVVR